MANQPLFRNPVRWIPVLLPPLLGALGWCTGVIDHSDPTLQVLNCLFVGVSAYFFTGCCRLLLPGAQSASYLTGTLFFASAPVLVSGAFIHSPDVAALALVLGAWYFTLYYEVRPTLLLWVSAGSFMALAGWVQPVSLGVWSVAGIWLLRLAWRRNKPMHVAVGLLALLVVAQLWAKPWFTEPSAAHFWTEWSLRHLLLPSPGTQGNYTLPNILHGLSPVCHPGFGILLPLFGVLFKKTDLQLPEKKVLAGAIGAHLLLLGGLPQQDVRHLLPIWALGLLLLFPAIDRAVSYGFFYARNVVIAVLLVGILLQMAGIVYYLRLLF